MILPEVAPIFSHHQVYIRKSNCRRVCCPHTPGLFVGQTSDRLLYCTNDITTICINNCDFGRKSGPLFHTLSKTLQHIVCSMYASDEMSPLVTCPVLNQDLSQSSELAIKVKGQDDKWTCRRC